MQVFLEAFKPEHIAEVDPAIAADGDAMALLVRHVGDGLALTGRLEDGRALACTGIAIERPGVGQAWSVPSPLVRQFKRELFVITKQVLRQAVAEFGLVRVYTAVLPCFRGWIEHLGFSCETPDGMRRFSLHGETMFLYALIPEESHVA